MFRQAFDLPATVWLLGVVSFCNDAASDMLYPLLPLYLTSVLGAGPKALGLIEGIADATASLLKLVAGVIADYAQRTKPLIICGYVLASLGRPLTGLVSSWPAVLFIRFGDRVGKGLRSSPRDALLAASVAPEQRGLAFGLHRAMDNGGAVVGPLVASALLAAQIPLREVFLWSLVPGLITIGLTLLIKESPAPNLATKPQLVWSWVGFEPVFQRYLVTTTLFTLGNASNMFLLLRAKELGLSDAQIPLLWALLSATATVFSTPLSALSDRCGRTGMLAAGWTAYTLFYALLGFVAINETQLYLVFAGYGIFLAATEGVEKAMVADLAPAELRGRAFGWFNLCTGVALLPASILFGALYEYGGPQLAFGFAAACALGAASLLMVWVGRTRPLA